MAKIDLYLASKSPRRKELLSQLGLLYEAVDVSCSEVLAEGERPDDYCLRIARDKALAGWKAIKPDVNVPVLGADTVVVRGSEVFGKPDSEARAKAMLAALSGREHRVLSSVALVKGDRVEQVLQANTVKFRQLSSAEIAAYWQTGEPLDKAGGYAIQGIAASFVERIEGSYSGVMGLPLFETSELLAKFGVSILKPTA